MAASSGRKLEVEELELKLEKLETKCSQMEKELDTHQNRHRELRDEVGDGKLKNNSVRMRAYVCEWMSECVYVCVCGVRNVAQSFVSVVKIFTFCLDEQKHLLYYRQPDPHVNTPYPRPILNLDPNPDPHLHPPHSHPTLTLTLTKPEAEAEPEF